jgi:hypothetical protein
MTLGRTSPTFNPSFRRASTASFAVSAAEFRMNSAASASSIRYRSSMPYDLPERAAYSAKTFFTTSSARSIASACCFLLLIWSGSFIYGPMVTGFDGSTDVTVGTKGPRKSRTTRSSSKISTRRFWWEVKKPSNATKMGRRTDMSSAIFGAMMFMS